MHCVEAPRTRPATATTYAYVRTRARTSPTSGPSPLSVVVAGSSRLAATAQRSTVDPWMVVTVGSSGRNSHCWPDGPTRRKATGPLMVRPDKAKAYGSVRQASLRDQLEPVGGLQVDSQRLGDVSGVDPGLSQPCGGQGPGREVPRHPGDPAREIHVAQDRHQAGCRRGPPIRHDLEWNPSLPVDHRGHAFVDGGSSPKAAACRPGRWHRSSPSGWPRPSRPIEPGGAGHRSRTTPRIGWLSPIRHPSGRPRVKLFRPAGRLTPRRRDPRRRA